MKLAWLQSMDLKQSKRKPGYNVKLNVLTHTHTYTHIYTHNIHMENKCNVVTSFKAVSVKRDYQQ